MYKRHTGQVSMLESPEMFGSLPLDPNNDWIKAKLCNYQLYIDNIITFKKEKDRPCVPR